MKTRYSRQQIFEAIRYWTDRYWTEQLEQLDESRGWTSEKFKRAMLSLSQALRKQILTDSSISNYETSLMLDTYEDGLNSMRKSLSNMPLLTLKKILSRERLSRDLAVLICNDILRLRMHGIDDGDFIG